MILKQTLKEQFKQLLADYYRGLRNLDIVLYPQTVTEIVEESGYVSKAPLYPCQQQPYSTPNNTRVSTYHY